RTNIYCKTLLNYGIGDSNDADKIANWNNNLPENIKEANLPSLEKVRFRLLSRSTDEHPFKEQINLRIEVLSDMLTDYAIGFEDETTIVGKIAHILNEKQRTLSLAESCTGGTIASQITAEPGASSFFLGSIIPYKTELKTKVLGVPASLIEEFSVVSVEVAESMALNSCRLFDTDYAIATTGIA